MHQFVAFIFQVNANATVVCHAHFPIAQLIELTKVENVSAIKCSDEIAFAYMTTKRNHTSSGHFMFKQSELGSIVDFLLHSDSAPSSLE